MKTSNSLFSFFQRFIHDNRGAAVIEFALTIPLLIILFLGTVEVSNFVYAQQKLQSAADNIVNIVNLQDDLSNQSNLTNIAEILPKVVRPLEISSNDYSVIITVIQRDFGEDFAYVIMQEKFGGGPSNSGFSFNASAAVSAENTASLADMNFSFEEGDQVVIVESYMSYSPLIDGSFSRSLLGLQDSFIYHRTPPAQPRIRRFHFKTGSGV